VEKSWVSPVGGIFEVEKSWFSLEEGFFEVEKSWKGFFYNILQVILNPLSFLSEKSKNPLDYCFFVNIF
jgi:hypothetical protein